MNESVESSEPPEIAAASEHRGNFLGPPEPILGLGSSTVGEFWEWVYSDILSNRNRSIFAEYIVGVALGVVDKARIEWTLQTSVTEVSRSR